MSKDLHNPQDYTFKICKIQTKTLESQENQYKHNKTTLADLENHEEPPINLTKIKPEGRLSLANQTSFSKFQNYIKLLQERSKINLQWYTSI